jgi:hypothetical protein
MREYIIKCYREAVALAAVPEELKRSLNVNERIPQFIDNLSVELSKVPKISPETIQTCVYDMTNLLLNSIEKKAREDYLSDAAKSAMRDAASEASKLDRLADRINQGTEENPAVIDMDEVMHG